ncbi:MAG: DUF3054 domain-containing protein [Chloroflexi bacterium]|nr:DUF3054 domain-containing protein [Chloroflexota bacterium]
MNKRTILILGDIAALAILTFIGFAMHGETALSFIPRMGTTFLPILFGWFLLAAWLGLFDEQVISNPKNLWRIILAMLFIAPLTATLRSALLGAAMLPLFPLILGGSNAIGLIVWRWLYIFIARRGIK